MADGAGPRLQRLLSALLVFSTAAAPIVAGGSTAASEDMRQTYVLVVEKKGWGETVFSGVYSVNGRQVTVERQRTPFRFSCEAGETIAGTFRADKPGDRIKVEVIDYGYSKKKPAATAWGDAIQFAWAQAGAGPRFLKVNEAVPR